MEINVQTVARAEMVWSVFLRTIVVTSIFYLAAQLYFGLACLLGLALAFEIDSSLVLTGVDKLTFETASGAGIALFILGMVGALLCGLLTFIVSLALFYFGGVRAFKGFSLLVLAICTVSLLIPLLNLLPLMWFWNLYVAWTNLKN